MDTPRIVVNCLDYYFYHTMDIPDYGTLTGEWDLRGKETEYLWNTNVRNKQV
jgi:hypothetical protein